MKIITVDKKPHLCLFAIKDISLGEEIRYNYGGSEWPWRHQVTSETVEPASLVCGDGSKTQTVTSETVEPASLVCGDGSKTQTSVHVSGINPATTRLYRPNHDSVKSNSDELFSDNSDEDYIPSDFSHDSESERFSLDPTKPHAKPISIIDSQEKIVVKGAEDTTEFEEVAEDTTEFVEVAEDTKECEKGPSVPSTDISTSVHKNFCFIYEKPQSKFTRHMKVHEKTNAEVARALALPKHSKQRKKLLENLRNKGNYEHNASVLAGGSGQLKIKRIPKKNYNPTDYVSCVYCHAMSLRRDLWRDM
ncbi:uncharacterized protein LOC130417806 isoform X2 [Triplophysa dalaica]|uniref:uncharacterized protein LOC130417806 isoform X2 n=1 Tax=Triplophysa dalaica TaxID=1582913 RepID=UPI0024DF684A|nr:uncharacterized protein LOC130417806 isoform X2 [Triplophysa dalaica]XP_056599589.1 uncharacterized protein LOC130417806 isoform X2 [Triplophysa dalaica]